MIGTPRDTIGNYFQAVYWGEGHIGVEGLGNRICQLSGRSLDVLSLLGCLAPLLLNYISFHPQDFGRWGSEHKLKCPFR